MRRNDLRPKLTLAEWAETIFDAVANASVEVSPFAPRTGASRRHSISPLRRRPKSVRGANGDTPPAGIRNLNLSNVCGVGLRKWDGLAQTVNPYGKRTMSRIFCITDLATRVAAVIQRLPEKWWRLGPSRTLGRWDLISGYEAAITEHHRPVMALSNSHVSGQAGHTLLLEGQLPTFSVSFLRRCWSWIRFIRWFFSGINDLIVCRSPSHQYEYAHPENNEQYCEKSVTRFL